MNTSERTNKSLNRLCKWRSVLVGRILGTRPFGDPQCRGYRDIFDKLLVIRAETSAVTRLLIERGVFTNEQFENAVAVEADFLAESYEKAFPGFRATDAGIAIYDTKMAAQTTKGWPE